VTFAFDSRIDASDSAPVTVQTAMAATICAILKFSIELAVPTGL
jgi:hypothetical protein